MTGQKEQQGAPRPRRPVQEAQPSFALLGVSALGIFGCGLVAGIFRAQNAEGEKFRKLPPTEQVKFWKRGHMQGQSFNATRHAAKALGVGTLLCASTAGAVAFAVGKVMDVSSVYEFADKIQTWAPQKRRQLEQMLNIKPNTTLEEEKQKVASMTYDQEIEHWQAIIMTEENKK